MLAPSGVTPTIYSDGERAGVAVIGAAGILSLSAPLLLLTRIPLRTQFHYTHAVAYFASLLISNTLQAIGSLMSFRWVSQGAVNAGQLCTTQGGIKQAGNVGTALWSFFIAVHLFNLLFLRYPETKIGLIATLVLGWALVIMFVMAGPAVVENSQKGPYFGVSGLWCWITAEYPMSRFFLEYFIEFLSAGLGFLLYTAILLRVRGNLYSHDGKWGLRFLAPGEGWKLSIGRDVIDSAILRVAVNMVRYPVAYSLLILPIALSRLISFSGHYVPPLATVFTAVIFNLTGFVNVILFICTRRLLPDTSNLPSFATPRKEINPKAAEANGVTPFLLTRSTADGNDEDKTIDTTSPVVRPESEGSIHYHGSHWSLGSDNSTTSLNRVAPSF
jgi:hypothetical protein